MEYIVKLQVEIDAYSPEHAVKRIERILDGYVINIISIDKDEDYDQKESP